MSIIDDDRFCEIDKRLGGPIVYIIHNDNEVIYIGSSVKGLARTFEGGHRHAAIITSINSRVSIMFCDSERQARIIEGELISKYKPRENKSDPHVGRARIRPVKVVKPIEMDGRKEVRLMAKELVDLGLFFSIKDAIAAVLAIKNQ